MSYDEKILSRATELYEADRRERQQRFAERQESIYRRAPRLREIQQRLGGTMSRIMAEALRKGADPQEAIKRLRDENLALQSEKRMLLTRMGMAHDALEEKPLCALCGDSGYTPDGRLCQCLRAYCAREQQRELSRMLDLGSQSFDSFSLDYYSDDPDPVMRISPRQNMERIFDYCSGYARSFGKKPRNLLLYGEPGLGKTFLSAAIAREVSERGFSVVYDTASGIFSRFEEQKFGDGDETEVMRILKCDLLILDDLGTELTTAFVTSALYRLVSERLMAKRSTIINTNLKPREIAGRYSAQIASRLEGEYEILPVFGSDIRLLKKMENR